MPDGTQQQKELIGLEVSELLKLLSSFLFHAKQQATRKVSK
jgi:hypothetical protein